MSRPPVTSTRKGLISRKISGAQTGTPPKSEPDTKRQEPGPGMRSQGPGPGKKLQQPGPDTKSQGPGPDTKSQGPEPGNKPEPGRPPDTEPGSTGQIC